MRRRWAPADGNASAGFIISNMIRSRKGLNMMKAWRVVTAGIIAISVAVVAFKILENANRVAHLRTMMGGRVGLRVALYAGIIVLLMGVCMMLADMAVGRVLRRKERLCLAGALLALACAIGTGIKCANDKTYTRSLDAIIDHHQLMRKWEPIWTEGRCR